MDVIPAIWTDKSDYRPGETVYIYGASFDVPSVHLNTAAGSSVIDERDVAVADGKFETILTLGSSPETATIIASYNSQVLAATSFTDSPTQTCVNLPAIDDAAVQHAHSTRNYGQNTILHTKYDDGSDVRRSYLKFDLSSIPAGSTINSATLSLFKQTGDNSRTVYLYLVATDTWVEGTCTDSHDSCGGGIKWENMPAYSTPCGSISVGSSYTYYPGVVTSCVQGEFSGDKKISLSAKVDETGSADRHEDFYSEEQSGTSQDPKLEVCYQAAPTQSCGNGIKEGTEACDGGACCNTDCTFKSSATECRASAGACDPAETCTGSSATCPTDDKAPVGTSCSNGLYCDGAETCDGAGSCAVGTSVTCNDGLSCTSDICNDNSDMCVFTPNDAACDDQNVCTTDVCSIIGGCSHPYNTASCDDSNQCTTSDVCALGVCAGTPKNCDDGNACTTDSCNPANGDCVHIISDQTGPFTSIPTVQPSFNNGVFNLNTNATDTCSNIQISKYYIGRSNESLGYCDDFSSSQFYVTGAMEPVDGSYNSTFEKVFKNNIAFFLDGVNFACVKSWDVNGNPGSCACAYFETDTLPPDCAYNIYLNGYFTPSNQLICQNSFTINATVCDKQSNIQGGEYFLDTQIPPVPTPGSGIWMTNLTRFARPTDGSLCAVIGASVDASHLQDGLHTINLRGKDAFNWGKIENCQEVSFIVDTTAPSTSKTLTPYQGSQHECTESDITGANLPVGVSLTNGCAFVKAGTTVTLHPSDQNPNSQVHWIVKYKVNPGDSWVDDQQGVGTPGQDVTITFSKDSYHLIEYWSVDACGNAEAHKYELDIVDTVAPSTEKTMTGTQIAGEGFTWITQGTTITLSCVDPAPHPSDHVTLYAKYNVDGGVNWIDIPTSNGYAQFHFNEDSVHTLQYYCVDALGNTEATQTEVDKVDTTAPVTTKTYGTPLVTTNGDYPKWITSATQVTLSSVDGGAICAIGQDKTYYKVTALADNIKCANQALCTPIHGYDAVWTQYTSGSPFTVAESSCHMIEYYSVDALGNKEPIRAQCVYVDNTSPASQKVVGDPKVPAECSSLGQGSFTDGCYYVTKATQVSLSCSDQGDHPVDNVAIHYKVDWKNQASDSWTEGSWAAGSSSVSFTYQEDSYHRLSWYCADALGNIEQTRTELDMVDTQAPVSTKDLGTPKHACNDTEQSTYYPGMAAPTAGCNFITKQTSITINCADQIPHPVGGETIKYKYYLLGSEPEAWT
ncbi:MAG: DNRLRE domain-containing protein, partial [Candidatus Aenigmarchaeota archaeon]|nr:DNRLRE domain-containing protein [Candidatus Aenigmarchaeota archaeon]